MTKDLALVLVQLIPVLALALGLEIRSLAGRVAVDLADMEDELHRSARDPHLRLGKSLQRAFDRAYDAWIFLMVCCLVQTFLAAFEVATLIRVLVLTEADKEMRDIGELLQFAVMIAFLAPAGEALVRTRRFLPSWFRLLGRGIDIGAGPSRRLMHKIWSFRGGIFVGVFGGVTFLVVEIIERTID